MWELDSCKFSRQKTVPLLLLFILTPIPCWTMDPIDDTLGKGLEPGTGIGGGGGGGAEERVKRVSFMNSSGHQQTMILPTGDDPIVTMVPSSTPLSSSSHNNGETGGHGGAGGMLSSLSASLARYNDAANPDHDNGISHHSIGGTSLKVEKEVEAIEEEANLEEEVEEEEEEEDPQNGEDKEEDEDHHGASNPPNARKEKSLSALASRSPPLHSPPLLALFDSFPCSPLGSWSSMARLSKK